jgi:hypothetical protein
VASEVHRRGRGARGWHYDVPPANGTPTKVVVCEATCRRFKLDQSAQVDLVFGCATETIR